VSLRLVGFCALMGGLITLSVFSRNVPRTRAVLLQAQAIQRPHDQRKLVKTEWPNMPARVNHGKLKKGLAQFGQAFNDLDDDWLDGFTINIQNTSTKSIVYIEVGLTFFKKEEGLVPEKIPFGYPISFGSGLGMFNTGRTFQPVKPGEAVDVVFTTDDLLRLKAMLVEDKYPLSFHHVDLCVEAIQFDDGELWYKSYIFYRDPYNPKRYVRDKYFKKGGKYEGIKPGTILNEGALLRVPETDSACPVRQIRSQQGFFWPKHVTDAGFSHTTRLSA